MTVKKEKLFGQRNFMFFVGIKALIIRNGRILVMRAGPLELSSTMRNKAFYDLPGGKIEHGEDVKQALRREVSEELGIKQDALVIEKIFEASVSRILISHGIEIPLILITFRCSLPSGLKFKLSGEHSRYEWMSMKRARKLLGSKFNGSFIEELAGR